jgi:hypothetical protein
VSKKKKKKKKENLGYSKEDIERMRKKFGWGAGDVIVTLPPKNK